MMSAACKEVAMKAIAKIEVINFFICFGFYLVSYILNNQPKTNYLKSQWFDNQICEEKALSAIA